MRSIVAASILTGLLLGGCATAPPPALVTPFAETVPVGSMDDAADDPAIWLNSADPARSLVLGTDKQTGLYVYDLAGRQTQALPLGLLNNLDLRQGLAGGDLAGASNRSDNSLTLMRIDSSSGAVSALSQTPTGRIEPYGFCMARAGDAWLAAIPYKDGVVQLFRAAEGPAGATAIAEWRFSGVMEGCVFDEENGAIFISEEAVGLWRVTHENGRETGRTLIDRVGSGTGLKADVEGVALWRGDAGAGWVIVSAQAADRYLVYDRKAPNTFRGSFRIAPSADGSVDGVSHTDGIEATSAALGAKLPRGLFVAQDDANTAPVAPQNFKFVDWREIERALALEVLPQPGG